MNIFLNNMRQGQVMILSIMAIGGTILAVTTVAGILMLYQIRQATESADSGKAVAAADTGIEWALYQFFQPNSTHPQPVLSNGATFTTQCFDVAGGLVSCAADEVVKIRAQGKYGNVTRALELNL